MAYRIDELPLHELLAPAMRATAALARLDERLARSPVREGWLERSHFHDAAAALWIAGELVHVEDLVFHDARADIRAPSHALTRAHEVLRMRRRIAAAPRVWALSAQGLRELTGPAGLAVERGGAGEGRGRPADLIAEAAADAAADQLADAFAEIDAVLARSSNTLAGRRRVSPESMVGEAGGVGIDTFGIRENRGADERRRDGPDGTPTGLLIYDADWDEAARLAEWQGVAEASAGLGPVLRAAMLLDAWAEIEVLQHGGFLGALLVAARLRQDRLTDHHLACLHLGAQRVSRERRRARSQAQRILAFLDAIEQAAVAGMKEHDRLVLARARMERTLAGRRSSSKLPGLVELVLARPLVSTGMVQARLRVSRQGALDLLAALDLRELTGRGRYRAWGVV